MNHKMVRQFAFVLAIAVSWIITSAAQQVSQQKTPSDAIDQAQRQKVSAATRPEQHKTAHDQSVEASAVNAKPASDIVDNQPKRGRISGFDFYRDPLNADQPNPNVDEIVKKESANKPNVMNAQRQLLESRYILD